MSTIRALTMPKWGIEMQEGTVTGWHKQVGDAVAEGEELIDIETDKIVNTVESPFAGVLRRVLVGEGDVRKVGALIGVIAAADVDETAIDTFVRDFAAVDASFEPEDASGGGAQRPADGPAVADGAAAGTRTAPAAGAELRISPIARKLADQLGVDLAGVTGTGRNGRISKEDVEAAARAQGLLADEGASDEAPAFELIRLTGTQRTAAQRLQAAKQEIPHFYLAVDLVTDALARVAREAGASLNSAIVKALGLALAAVPEANVQFADEDGALRRFRAVDLGIAVATPRGLLAPVVRDVAAAPLADLDQAIRALAERARNRELEAADLEGGSATVSNLGMFGVDRFAAIVNPPQTSILAVGRAAPRPVATADGIAVRAVMTATLSCDHRAIDGALGARVLAAFRAAVESGLETTGESPS